MSRRSSKSRLQDRILLYLEHSEVDSIAELALKLDARQSSVSEAMHALESSGLVSKTNGRWSAPLARKEQAQGIRCQLPERVIEPAGCQCEQGRLSGLGSTPYAKVTADEPPSLYIAAISQSAKSILDTATRMSMQPSMAFPNGIASLTRAHESAQAMMGAAAGVDLLALSQSAMRSISGVVAGVDSMAFASGSTWPLMNSVASVELITSARDAIQSVASVAAKYTASVGHEYAVQPLVSAAAKYDLQVSAQDAIRPLMDASIRFDSLVSGVTSRQPFTTLQREGLLPLLAQETVQPLVDAAKRYDLITSAQEFMQPLIRTVDGMGSLTSVQERNGALTNLIVESQSRISALGIMSSAQVTAAFGAIESISLKPSILEIAASQASLAIGDCSQSILTEIYPRLTQEALISFSESRRMGLASIEQLSVLSDLGPSIVREVSASNLELGSIIGELVTISARGHIQTGWAAMIPNIAEVGRTYKGYLADVFGGLNESLAGHRMNVGIAIPTMATSAYVSSVKTAILADVSDDDDVLLVKAAPFAPREKAAQFDAMFQDLGPNFTAMWQGSWAVLDSRSPDRIRQSAHSGRELLMQTLAKLAPDSAFDAVEIEKYGNKGKVTRRMRVKKILGRGRKSAAGWVDSMARALDESYDQLADVSHDRSIHPGATEQQLVGLLSSLGGLVLFLRASQNANSQDS